MKKKCFNFLVILSSCFFILSTSLFATTIRDEKELVALLELSDEQTLTSALNYAKEQLILRESRKGRSIKVLKIKDFFDLSDKYLALSYDINILPNTPSIVVFLFERVSSGLEMSKSSNYLLFVSDLDAYKNIDEAGICEYFRKMGVSDCVPVFTQRKWKQMLSEKADKTHVHNLATLSGVLPESKIDSELVRKSDLKIALETKADLSLIQPLMVGGAIAVSGSKDDLQQKVANLEAQLARLTRLLEGVQRSGQNLQFQGLNLVLSNGEGRTANTGNLIIGHNDSEKIAGSHNLIIGEGHRCKGNSNLISGFSHLVENSNTAAIAGKNNIVKGESAFIIGGEKNQAGGAFAAILGGSRNKAEGDRSIISGGENRAVMKSNPHFTGE